MKTALEHEWTLLELLNELAILDPTPDQLTGVHEHFDSKGPTVRRTQLQLVRDHSGRGSEPWTDLLLLRHLKGESIADITADVQERRRLVGRAPAYRWLNEKLWRTMLDGNLKDIPAPDVRRDLIRDQHVLSGHLGWKRTTALLCQKYYWAKLDSDVRLVLSVCHECKRRHVAFTAKDPILHPLQPKGLCYRWGLDLCQLPTTAWGFQRVMICVEHLSRYVIIIPLRNKSSAEVAFAFLTQVIATYGVCGEVLSDQGGEFMGEMHCLLQRNGIEHRRTSAYRAQSNGLAERAVQTVKKAVSKLAASKGKQSSSFQWEWELAYLQLAYNSSPQASTKLTPSQVMMAQAPEMPPSLRTHLDVPIDLWALDADQVNVAADLVRRAEQVKRLGVQATANLQVAQHRDSKQYARRQSGAYVRPSFVPKAGDYVYLYHKPLNSTSMSTDKLPVRIVSISKDGVATMEGRVANKFIKRHITTLAPCHLTNIISEQSADILDYEDTICQKCLSPEDYPNMLLCDGCNEGLHLYCFEPKVASVPEGDWYCPKCVASPDKIAPSNVDSQGFVLETAAETPDPPAELLDNPYNISTEPEPEAPSPANAQVLITPDRLPEASVATSVPALAAEPAISERELRALRRAQAVSRRCQSGYSIEEQVAKGMLQPMVVRRVTELPSEPLSVQELDALCQYYMPGVWPPGTITRYWNVIHQQCDSLAQPYSYPPRSTGYETDKEALTINAAAYGTAGTTIVMTLPSEIDSLLEHVNVSKSGYVLDPWAGTCSIEAALQKRQIFNVISNDLNPASSAITHMCSLRPSSYDHWTDVATANNSRLGAIVTSPHWHYLDLAIPLAVEYAEDVACIHVPWTYFSDMPERRKKYLINLSRSKRLHVIQCKNAGSYGKVCAWLVIFKDNHTRKLLALTRELRDGPPQGTTNSVNLTFT